MKGVPSFESHVKYNSSLSLGCGIKREFCEGIRFLSVLLFSDGIPSCNGPHRASTLFLYVEMEIMLDWIVVYMIFFIQMMDNFESSVQQRLLLSEWIYFSRRRSGYSSILVCLLLVQGMVCVMYIICLEFLTGQRNRMCLLFLPEHVFAASGVSVHHTVNLTDVSGQVQWGVHKHRRDTTYPIVPSALNPLLPTTEANPFP